MTSSSKTVVAVLVAIVIVAVIGAYEYGASSFQLSTLQSEVSSLESHPITEVTTMTSTITSTETSLTAVDLTTTEFPGIPWNGTVAFVSGPDGGTGAISFSNRLSDALLFDCTTAATSGCSVQTDNPSTGQNSSVVATYPITGQLGEPAWANCMYTLLELPSGQQIPGSGGPTPAFCISIGPTAFIVAQQGPSQTTPAG
jgi:hypothetical protein